MMKAQWKVFNAAKNWSLGQTTIPTEILPPDSIVLLTELDTPEELLQQFKEKMKADTFIQE